MEMILGNPNKDMTDPPPCGLYTDCEKVKIFTSINKDSLKLILCDIFIRGSNTYRPDNVCDFLREYPDFGVNMLKAKLNSKIPFSSIKKIIFKLIVFRIIDLKYDEDQSKIIFGPERCNIKFVDLAMNSYALWNGIEFLS